VGHWRGVSALYLNTLRAIRLETWLGRSAMGDDRPKAKRVFTNADFASTPLEEKPSISPQKQGAQPSRTIRTLNGVQDPQAIAQQRRLTELGQRVQFLESEIRDLDAQRISLRGSAVYGDVKRISQNEEMHRLQAEIEGKHKQLAAASNDLAEEIERSQRASIVRPGLSGLSLPPRLSGWHSSHSVHSQPAGRQVFWRQNVLRFRAARGCRHRPSA
jgi:hypothetical protein